MCIQEDKLSAICEKVMDKCLAPSIVGGEGCDNMTMILVQFKKPVTPTDAASSSLPPVLTVEDQSSSPSTSDKESKRELEMDKEPSSEQQHT